MSLSLHNTLTGKKEPFDLPKDHEVTMYNCGPTVYNYAHIGNLRAYVFADTLRRTLEAMRQVADKYTSAFVEDIKALNCKLPHEMPKASEHISEDIELIKKLEAKGIAYKTRDGVYFDTSKFPGYGKLGNINMKGQFAGARVAVNSEKKNPADFTLWKASRNDIGWESPWGKGFPGWHIECSAMSRKYLGQPFDIHTGGIDHIPVHHNNEIAQSESAFGLPLANFWLHNEFLKVDGQKMSKSLGNIYTIKNLIENKVHPLSFRYWLLTSHYSTGANFTWESVRGTQSAFEKIISNYPFLLDSHETYKSIQEQFEEAIADNLNTPIAISLLQEAKSKEIIDQMDKVLGLNIRNVADKMYNIPEDILELKKERDVARAEKNWQESDQLRNQIEESGYILEDRDNNSIIRKTLQNLL